MKILKRKKVEKADRLSEPPGDDTLTEHFKSLWDFLRTLLG
ncbi:hypothetical protein ACFLZV_01320 [Candidatus Margulisiibacteriota bacterium]